MIPLVDLKRQYRSIQSDIDQAIQNVLDTTSFINGPHVQKFELNFAQATGALYGVGTSSGTTALHLALMALGIGPGDEVITVPNTFIATTEAISQTGARIRFVDINQKTYNIDIGQLKAAITENTKAIIPVYLYGRPCDIEEITDLARNLDIKVIVDAAQAHLSKFNGKSIGIYGDAVTYSFYPGKNLGAYGDAGIVTTNDEELAQRMRMLANHGRKDKYLHLEEGYNYRLDALQAAILNVKLKHLAQWTKRRQQIARHYDIMLAGNDVITPWIDERVEHVFHLYVVRLKNRELVKNYLKDHNIATGVHYPIPLHLQPAYRYLGYQEGDFPITEQYSKEILSLPMFPELEDEEVKKVVETLKETLGATTTLKEIQNV